MWQVNPVARREVLQGWARGFPAPSPGSPELGDGVVTAGATERESPTRRLYTLPSFRTHCISGGFAQLLGHRQLSRSRYGSPRHMESTECGLSGASNQRKPETPRPVEATGVDNRAKVQNTSKVILNPPL